MDTTRIELAIDAMECCDGDADDYSCDDIRTAWLCAELNAGSGIKGGFDALWIDRS